MPEPGVNLVDGLGEGAVVSLGEGEGHEAPTDGHDAKDDGRQPRSNVVLSSSTEWTYKRGGESRMLIAH